MKKVSKTTVYGGFINIYGAKCSKYSSCKVIGKREDFPGAILYNIGVKHEPVAKILEKKENANEKQNHLDRIIFENFGKRMDHTGKQALSKPIDTQAVSRCFPGI